MGDLKDETAVDVFEQEVKEGSRFEFGKNWKSFLSMLDDERVAEAEKSLCEMLEVRTLDTKRFLDIGSGSGLFSLAAYRLGATVRSFDLDPTSVSCAQELRSRSSDNDNEWIIEQGSVLDGGFLSSLGKFDIVYAWGVLHHTGDLWKALENAATLVDKHGILFIAIYGDQGKKSEFWLRVKKAYCSGTAAKLIVCSIFIPYFFTRAVGSSILGRRNVFSDKKRKRGMSIYHDWLDKLGGLPYEVAKPEHIIRFYIGRGFSVRNLKLTMGGANNQFVFVNE